VAFTGGEAKVQAIGRLAIRLDPVGRPHSVAAVARVRERVARAWIESQTQQRAGRRIGNLRREPDHRGDHSRRSSCPLGIGEHAGAYARLERVDRKVLVLPGNEPRSRSVRSVALDPLSY
jgi:hypothetical protein